MYVGMDLHLHVALVGRCEISDVDISKRQHQLHHSHSATLGDEFFSDFG